MIGSLMSRMGTAEKLSIPQIQQAIQDGTLPAYVGIPMLQEKMKQQQAMRAPQPPQPSIAEQVMAQAQSEGIPQLQSNLPAQGMAGGGIVAFAGGGYSDGASEDDDEDSYDLAEANQAMDDASLSRAIMARSNPNKPAGSSLMNMLPEGITSLVRRVSETFSKPAEGAAAPKEPTKGKHKYYEKIVSEAEKLSLNPDFALRIAQKETGNLANPESAVSPAGALGVMQLMPRTARGLGVKDPMNPDENIVGGVRYAKQMLDKYGDERLAAMAYNWGPGNVDKWLKSGQGIEALPRETQKYAASFAEGGPVAHFDIGGFSGSAMGPFPNEAAETLAEARARAAARAAARSAAASAPTAAAEAPALARGIGSLVSRATVPLMVGSAGYGIGEAMLKKRQAEELAKYGPEPEPTAEELARAAAPLTAPPSMSRKIQQQFGATPLAPLTYTPAGVETYGPRPGYTPPKKSVRADSSVFDREDAEAGPSMAAMSQNVDQSAFEKKIQELQAQPMRTATEEKEKPAAKEAPSSMDEYLAMLKGGYDDMKKQKEEDKYLALLAAGLGMMGGTSQYAAANIGAGAMHGVSSLMEANKQRAAEKSALDRAYGQGLYRQNLGEMTSANKAEQLAIQRGALELNQKKELDSVLNNVQQQAEKRALAALKTQGLIGLDTPGEEVAAKVSGWVAQDLARNKSFKDLYKQRWGYDYDVPAAPTGGAGWSAKVK